MDPMDWRSFSRARAGDKHDNGELCQDARGGRVSMTNARRVLLTNDDGVKARGLHALKTALVDYGFDVLVVAPAENQSGVSRSATYRGPVVLERLNQAGRFACHGTPVDCVRSTLLSDLGSGVELVVSGINHGANLGDDTLNSGTVGAAVEGALLGVPAIAISQQSHPGHFHILDALDQTTPVYDHTARIGALAVATVLDGDEPPHRSVLNLNVPAQLREDEVRVTRLGRRFYPRASVPPEGSDGALAFRTFGERTGAPPPFESESETDFRAIEDGVVSVTGLSYAWHAGSRGRAALASWTRATANELQRRIVAEAGARA
jgi:5'-nucleotidase